MFFYLLHLSVLRILYHSALAIWGPNHGNTFGVDSYGWVVVWNFLTGRCMEPGPASAG